MWRRNFLWKMASLVFGGGLAFLFQLILMKTLGASHYGLWTLAIGWAGLCSVLVDYGFNPLLARDVARNPASAYPYWRATVRGKLTLALVGASLLCLAAFLYPHRPITLAFLMTAYVYLCGISLGESMQSLTYATDRFRLGTLLAITQKGLTTGLGFLAIVIVTHWEGIFTTVAIASVLSAILVSLVMKELLRRKHSESATPMRTRQLLRAGLPLFLQNFFIVIYFRVDTVMLGHYLTPHDVGVYGAAYRFFELSNVIPTALTAAWIAPLARSLEKRDDTSLWKRALMIYVAFALVGILALQLVAHLAPVQWLGHDFVMISPLLAVLSWTLLFYFPNYLLTTTLVLLGKPGWNVWVAGFAALFNVAANCWTIPRWGGVGAAWATFATEGLLLLISVLLVTSIFNDRSDRGYL